MKNQIVWVLFDPVEIIDDRKENQSKRLEVLNDIQKAQSSLLSYEIILTIKKNEPVYGLIQFIHQDLEKYSRLKKYVDKYGFVVPVNVTEHVKVLKGEKKIKYKT